MSIVDFIRKKKSVAGMHTTYGLTALGKTKAEAYVASNPQAEVLASLNENGVMTIPELCEEVKTSPQKMKYILKGLLRSGYIRRVSQED